MQSAGGEAEEETEAQGSQVSFELDTHTVAQIVMLPILGVLGWFLKKVGNEIKNLRELLHDGIKNKVADLGTRMEKLEQHLDRQDASMDVVKRRVTDKR